MDVAQPVHLLTSNRHVITSEMWKYNLALEEHCETRWTGSVLTGESFLYSGHV